MRPPTLISEFMQQFGGAYFSTEGALWRTLKLLLLKPGELTVQYLAGRRKHLRAAAAAVPEHQPGLFLLLGAWRRFRPGGRRAPR
jgi:hypothetical protein